LEHRQHLHTKHGRNAFELRTTWSSEYFLFLTAITSESWVHPWAGFKLGRVGQNYIPVNGVYTVFLAGESPNIRSHTLHIYGSGQP
jgi:hypothetical protein